MRILAVFSASVALFVSAAGWAAVTHTVQLWLDPQSALEGLVLDRQERELKTDSSGGPGVLVTGRNLYVNSTLRLSGEVIPTQPDGAFRVFVPIHEPVTILRFEVRTLGGVLYQKVKLLMRRESDRQPPPQSARSSTNHREEPETKEAVEAEASPVEGDRSVEPNEVERLTGVELGLSTGYFRYQGAPSFNQGNLDLRFAGTTRLFSSRWFLAGDLSWTALAVAPTGVRIRYVSASVRGLTPLLLGGSSELWFGVGVDYENMVGTTGYGYRNPAGPEISTLFRWSPGPSEWRAGVRLAALGYNPLTAANARVQISRHLSAHRRLWIEAGGVKLGSASLLSGSIGFGFQL